jgi:3-oxoacyl-[acyl-carrier protein] reductase
MTLADQIALVTGASRGIGKAIAVALLKEGATVIGTSTTEGGAAGISEAIKLAGGKGRGMVLDVTAKGAIEPLIEAIETEFGPIGVLVNNAGITKDNLAMRMKEAEWDSVIDADLRAVFQLSKAVLRGMMKARRGRIINITSVIGSSGNAGQANYAAAKAGVGGMTRSLAQEIGSRGITVNCIAPGFIDTDMTRVLADAQKAVLVDRIPLGRLGTPEDIAAAVAFLASPAASYITGVTLHVNGGLYMA